MTPTLAVADLHVALGRRAPVPLLRGVSLSVAPGEVRGLVGESGAGKSMIARAIFDLLPREARITRGAILFEGGDLVAMPEKPRRRLLGRDIALIPQDPMTSLNPVKRVGEQIATVLRLKLGLSRRAALARALDLLGDVAIREPARVLSSYPHELSGGMRQRILIAIAFACRPRLVVADEPTTALDVTVQRQILRLIHDLQHRDNAAVLFVTHDLGLVAKLCQSVTVLHAGRVVEQGSVRDVLRAPAHAYTQALLSATPRLDRPADALAPMPRALVERLAEEARIYDLANQANYQ
jgi:peptide/nickel transport system ATP-binding protein